MNRVDAFFTDIAKMGLLARLALDRGMTREEALTSAASAYASIVGDSFLANVGPSYGVAWLENSFATIRLNEMLAASLMCTKIPSDVANALVLPWRCFRIDARSLGSILVLKSRSDGRFRTFWMHPDFSSRAGHTDEGSLGGYLEKLKDVWPGPEVDTSDLPDGGIAALTRADEMLGRLLVGVCLEMSNRETKACTIPPAYRAYTHKPGRAPEPRAWHFELRRSVRVDVTRGAKAYIQEGSRTPLVQSLVRGHHKRQAFGAQGKERKWIHVEPYWRGPEDAPIALRHHELRGAPRP